MTSCQPDQHPANLTTLCQHVHPTNQIIPCQLEHLHPDIMTNPQPTWPTPNQPDYLHANFTFPLLIWPPLPTRLTPPCQPDLPLPTWPPLPTRPPLTTWPSPCQPDTPYQPIHHRQHEHPPTNLTCQPDQPSVILNILMPTRTPSCKLDLLDHLYHKGHSETCCPIPLSFFYSVDHKFIVRFLAFLKKQ